MILNFCMYIIECDCVVTFINQTCEDHAFATCHANCLEDFLYPQIAKWSFSWCMQFHEAVELWVHKPKFRCSRNNSTMAPSHESREHGSRYLPQYGFGPILDFADLVGSNQFLFRVYTPKERSPFFDDTEPFFIAPKFDERYRNVTPGGWKDWELDGKTTVANATYEDVAAHMSWTTRSSSPYISTSFSPMWSIWEAVRRYHHGVKQDVEIAIIDAHAISDRAVTAASLLSKATSREYVRVILFFPGTFTYNILDVTNHIGSGFASRKNHKPFSFMVPFLVLQSLHLYR